MLVIYGNMLSREFAANNLIIDNPKLDKTIYHQVIA